MLDSDKNSFAFTSSWLDSYAYTGTYESEGKVITLKDDGGKGTFVFRIKDDELIFDASRSSKMPMDKYSVADGTESEICVPDGAIFIKNG